MTDKEFMADVLKHALLYIARGWAVFPLHSMTMKHECTCGTSNCADAGKHPRIRAWHKGASKDEKQIREWFGPKAPLSNIALCCGETSGITVLDVDTGPGKSGAESWAEATREKGEPVTLIQRTGSGGQHAVFKYISTVKTASNVLGKGIDSRNDGGYIVAAPSRHRSGGVYKWDNWGQELAAMPAHLATRKESRGRGRKDDPSRHRYTVDHVVEMLAHISADDRDMWRQVGIILGREFNQADAAWKAYVDWSNTWKGRKGRNHDQIMHEAFHIISQQSSSKELTLGTIIKAAVEGGWVPKAGGIPIQHFVYYGTGNNFIYRPTIAQNWVAEAVNYCVSQVNVNGQLIKAAEWIRQNVMCTSITCDPSIEEDYVKGYDCKDGIIIPVQGAALFNTYRKPTIESGDARLAHPFVNHVKRLFNKPGDAKQFLDYMAHRVQKPWEKPRFALLIAGGQGIGKDTAIESCIPAMGSWNVANIDPSALDSPFNEYAESVLVRINETSNLHELNKFAFNERTKVLIAGIPDITAINPKYGHKRVIRMYCGVIMTTNNLATGIYIPADDRRYDVMDCATLEEMGLVDDKKRREYFDEYWHWFLKEGGDTHVAAFLRERNIKDFSAAQGQRKTEAHKALVLTNMTSDQWLDDIIDELGSPDQLRADWLINRAVQGGEKEADVRRKLAAVIGRMGYVLLRNPNIADGRWKVAGKKVTVYVKAGFNANQFDPSKLAQEPL